MSPLWWAGMALLFVSFIPGFENLAIAAIVLFTLSLLDMDY